MEKKTEEIYEKIVNDYEGVEKPEEEPLYDNFEYENYLQEVLSDKGIEVEYDKLRRLATSYYAELVELGYDDEDYIIDNEDKEKAFKKVARDILKVNIDEIESPMRR